MYLSLKNAFLTKDSSCLLEAMHRYISPELLMFNRSQEVKKNASAAQKNAKKRQEDTKTSLQSITFCQKDSQEGQTLFIVVTILASRASKGCFTLFLHQTWSVSPFVTVQFYGELNFN